MFPTASSGCVPATRHQQPGRFRTDADAPGAGAAAGRLGRRPHRRSCNRAEVVGGGERGGARHRDSGRGWRRETAVEADFRKYWELGRSDLAERAGVVSLDPLSCWSYALCALTPNRQAAYRLLSPARSSLYLPASAPCDGSCVTRTLAVGQRVRAQRHAGRRAPPGPVSVPGQPAVVT